jgi:transposase
MSSRGPYRHHAPRFKLQLCQDIRSGVLSRREAQKRYSLSANLIQLWLTLFDRGELEGDEVEAAAIVDYEAKIAALERKVGQLTMELDLLKKTPRLRLVSDNETSSIISGPKAVPSDGGAK